MYRSFVNLDKSWCCCGPGSWAVGRWKGPGVHEMPGEQPHTQGVLLQSLQLLQLWRQTLHGPAPLVAVLFKKNQFTIKKVLKTQF